MTPLPFGFRDSDEKCTVIWNVLLLYVIYHFSLVTIKIFFLSLDSNCLIIICLVLDFFGIILFMLQWASWICWFMSFARFEKFPAIISLNTSLHCILFPLSRTSRISDLLILPHKFMKAWIFFSAFYSGWLISIDSSLSTLTLTFSVLHWTYPANLLTCFIFQV